MKSAIYTTASAAFQVSHILYAGSIQELPEERRKDGNTHSFKIITTSGTSYLYFKSEETAKNARAALGAKLRDVKPNTYTYCYDIIDPKAVVSFSPVFPLKTPQGSCTHVFTVTLAANQAKEEKVWLKYKSEDNAKKGRIALFAAISAANGERQASSSEAPAAAPVAVAAAVSADKSGLPF